MEVCFEEAARAKNYNKNIELPYYELERLYENAESGKQFPKDFLETQKARPHPDPNFAKNPMYHLATRCTKVPRASCCLLKASIPYRQMSRWNRTRAPPPRLQSV